MIKKQVIKKNQVWKSKKMFNGSHIYLLVKNKCGSKWRLFNGKETHKMKPQVIFRWYTLEENVNVR